MSVDILVGLQWGDEGKGRVVAGMSDYQACVRVNGGPNAGHTIDPERGIKVHQVPPMILDPDVKLVIASGSVVDVEALAGEVNDLEGLGFDIRRRLIVSYKAHVLTSAHRARDQGAMASKIGTTRTGNGPVHADKYARTGLTIADELPRLNRERIMVGDTADYLHKLKGPVLLMVAHGTMLDIDHGTYPYVTSSHCTAGGALASAGLGPLQVRRVIGVAKAYTTRVAPGPMRGEMPEEIANKVRLAGNEYGTTTGRARRVGWLDLGQLSYACKLNSVSELVLNKADVLAGLPEVGFIEDPWTFDSEIVSWHAGWTWASPEDPEFAHFLTHVNQFTYPAHVQHIGFGPAPEDTFRL